MTFERTVTFPSIKVWDSETRADVILPAFTETFQIEIDIEMIARRFGYKAAKSKGRKAKEMGGLVTVKAL